MSAWDPMLYLRFGDERTPRGARSPRPGADRSGPGLVYDLGCGPGNSTELLVRRFPDAEIVGIDSSPRDARRAPAQSLPDDRFPHGRFAALAARTAGGFALRQRRFPMDSQSPRYFRDIARDRSPPGGVLAVQMPDNLAEPAKTLMRETAAEGPWAAKLAAVREAREACCPLAGGLL